LIPIEQTKIIVEDELIAARAWAVRHNAGIEWFPDSLELRVILRQVGSNTPFFLRGTFRDYRALPPAWTFSNENWETAGRPDDFPKGVQTRFGASMFIMHNQTAVICIPFNRSAYADQGGPHGDWGGIANWPNAGASYVHADTIGDMLQAINRDFSLTRQRMSDA
jgi:hypothetical protein